MNLKNRIIPIVITLCIVLSLCIQSIATPSVEVNFNMMTEPKYIFKMTSEKIKTFFEEESTSVIFNSATSTPYFGTLVFNGSPLLKDITVLAFEVTDAETFTNADAEQGLQVLENELFDSIVHSIQKRQISTCIYTYACNIKAENGSVYFYMAFYMGCKVSGLDSLKENFIKPELKNWQKLTDAQKIAKLNEFILDDQFSYDIENNYRKSTISFVEDKRGIAEDYAGLTSLFLDEMGLENIIITGQVLNSDDEKVPHIWNMVKIEDDWYHLDIFKNGPVNAKGKHTKITKNYLLKSTNTFEKDHFPDSEFSQYTKLATKDYVLEEEIVQPEKPEISEMDAERLILKDLLAKGYDIITNHGEEYTADSIKNLISIYNDSREIYVNPTATLDEIKAAQTMLTTILSSLAKPEAVNKDGLFSALGSAYEMLFYPEVAILYPAASLRDLEKVYNNAVSVYTNDNATQNQVNNARWTLWSKINEIKDSIKEPEPTVPETPVIPEVPDTPTIPEEPVTPTTPETPTEPEEPVVPEEPQEPTNPIQPETPVNPEEPNEPSAPDEPQIPVDPVQPDNPETPNKPENPTAPINPTEPPEEKKFSTDIILYAVLAIVAAGGIVFLIIDSAKKRKIAANEESIMPVTSTLPAEDSDEEYEELEAVVIPQETDKDPEANESKDDELDTLVIPEAEGLKEISSNKELDDSEIRIAPIEEAAQKEAEEASSDSKNDNHTDKPEDNVTETAEKVAVENSGTEDNKNDQGQEKEQIEKTLPEENKNENVSE